MKMIRRRPTSPMGKSLPGTGSRGGKCGALFRLSMIAIIVGSLIYLATGFREAVDLASQKMAVLRSSASTRGESNPDLVGLTSKDDVVELVRPASDGAVRPAQEQDIEEEMEDDALQRAEEKAAKEEAAQDDSNASDVPEEEEEEKETDEMPNPPNDGKVVKVEEKAVVHEEDDVPVVDERNVVVEDKTVSIDDDVEEDLDNEEHAVDEDAQDVVVEGAPTEDEEDDEDNDEDDEEEAPGQMKDTGPKKIPKYTREELEERGFGHVLYAYRVVAPTVAIRTKPSPIGALAAISKDKMGLTKSSAKMGEIVVGYKLAKVHGLWLKIGPYTWAPVTKKESLDGPFHPVMKQIRKISIPGNLRKYWRTRVIDCESAYKKLESRQLCADKNMIRNGVLNVMRRMKLIDSSMDPDVHKFPSRHRLLHTASSSVDELKPSSRREPSINAEVPQAESDAESSEVVNSRSTQPDQSIQSDPSAVVAEQQNEMTTEGGEGDFDAEDEEDVVDTDVGCREFKYWHLCARHAKCAWRRLPNHEYCDLDTDPPIDSKTLPVNLRQQAKYDFRESTRKQPTPKYVVYQPSGGWNNQRLLLESALIICKLLNRTCILPPAAPHSNYFQNYNNLPASAIVGMPRVLNFEALNKVVPTVAIPEGMTFKQFMDKEMFGSPRKFSVKTVFRDVTKYKPGAMKKWAERDIVKLFSTDSADILFFANQTLWGTIEWKGSLAGWKERKQIHLAVMYPDHMKQVARKIAENLGPFHAVHVRRGDKVFETSFSKLYHDADWYSSKIAEYRNLSPKVYIATDEPSRAYFDAFKNYQLNIVFWETLPGFDEILKPYLQHFPKRMFMDVLGMIEQLLCTYAIMFLGSGYSTFTTYILRLRKYREILASDTSFSDPLQGLPASVRSLKSDCDPIKALGHSKPC